MERGKIKQRPVSQAHPAGRLRRAVVLATACLAAVPVALAAPPPGAVANFEGAQTNPIRLSPDGTRLFAVNTPAGTVSVFDVRQPDRTLLIAEIPVGLEPVSVNPRSNDEAWVVNQVSDSVSIVSVSKGIVTETLRVRDEPADVVFAGPRAYVSVSRSNRIDVFDTAARARIASLPIFGGNPRALAVSPDGALVYAAFALSGNGTTIIPPGLAPPQPDPTNPALPPPPQVGLIVKANDPQWAAQLSYTLPDNDVAVIDAGANPSIVGYYSGVGTINLGLAVNPVRGDLWIANTEALNTIHFEPNVRGHFVDNRVTRIDIATGNITAFDLNPTIDYSILPNPSARAIALAQPTSIVFDPSGLRMYVAAFGTDRVAVVDFSGNVLSRIEIAYLSGAGANVDPRRKRGPRGLALNASAKKLYVLNRISNTISVVDTQLQRVLTEIPVGFDPTPEEIRVGRGFLYDAKLSGNGTASCASCHIDADMDHLAWDLGDPAGDMQSTVQDGQVIQFHPMKGPMTTQTLRGLTDLTPLHWRGDRAGFPAFNPAFDSLMGGVPLSSGDMLAFTSYVNTILFQPNPFQNLDRTFPDSILGGNPAAGFTNFVTLELAVQAIGAQPRTCNSCHLANPGPGTDRTIDAADFVQPLKVPQLRNLYQKLLFNPFGPQSIDGFGLDHDGRVGGLFAFLRGAAFAAYSDQQATDIAAFLRTFDTGTAPAVGYTLTVTPNNLDTYLAEGNGTVLEAQALVGNIDLVVRGTINGAVHGLLYEPSTGRYIADNPALGPYTARDLEALVRAGDTLSLMGVFPGTGSAAPIGAADLTPEAFLFPDQTGVARSTSILSAPVTIAGITGSAPITVNGGEYSVGCGAVFTSAPETISNGQTVCVRHSSSAAFASDTSTTLTIGGVSDTFTSATVAAGTPSAFTFVDQANVGVSATITSNAVTIMGISATSEGIAAISVTGGSYSIGCGATFTGASGYIRNDQTVCVRQTSAATDDTSTNTTLTIGGVSDTFTTTTAVASGGGGGGGGGGALDGFSLLALGLMGALRRKAAPPPLRLVPRAGLEPARPFTANGF